MAFTAVELKILFRTIWHPVGDWIADIRSRLDSTTVDVDAAVAAAAAATAAAASASSAAAAAQSTATAAAAAAAALQADIDLLSDIMGKLNGDPNGPPIGTIVAPSASRNNHTTALAFADGASGLATKVIAIQADGACYIKTGANSVAASSADLKLAADERVEMKMTQGWLACFPISGTVTLKVWELV